MKLSELFKTPFKLKGGSTLNLKGFSEVIVDKEIDNNDIKGIKFIPKNEVLVKKGSNPRSPGDDIIIVNSQEANKVLAFQVNNVFYGFGKASASSDKATIIFQQDENCLKEICREDAIVFKYNGAPFYEATEDTILTGIIVEN